MHNIILLNSISGYKGPISIVFQLLHLLIMIYYRFVVMPKQRKEKNEEFLKNLKLINKLKKNRRNSNFLLYNSIYILLFFLFLFFIMISDFSFTVCNFRVNKRNKYES